MVPGNESADDWAALCASGIIAFNAYRLFRPALAELMDTAPPSKLELDIREIASTVEGVKSLDKCFVRKVGFEYYVDLENIAKVGHWISAKGGHRFSPKGGHWQKAFLEEKTQEKNGQ